MKKWLLVLAVISVLSLVGCKVKENDVQEENVGNISGEQIEARTKYINEAISPKLVLDETLETAEISEDSKYAKISNEYVLA